MASATGPFAFFEPVHQSYFQEYEPFDTVNFRAPLKFKVQLPIALPAATGSSYHKLTVAYDSHLFVSGQAADNDLAIFKPVCYLKGARLQRCTIDSGARTVLGEFQFGLALDEVVAVYFAVVDPRNPNSEGFRYNPGASSNSAIFSVLKLQQAGSAIVYYVESEPLLALYSLPSTTAAGPNNGISAGSFQGTHAQANRLNLVEFTLTFSRTDVAGLVIEIPMLTEKGSPIYTN